MHFHEVQFPTDLSFGALGGPQRRVDVVTLANGFEERNTPWAHSRRVYDAGLGLRSLDDVENVIAFYEARFGQMYGFRWKDWSDFKSGKPSVAINRQDQQIALGDGVTTTFQLIKTYRSGGHVYERPITKPVRGSVLIAVEQDDKLDTIDYTVDDTTGLITFTNPPDPDTRVFAGYEFDVPVRFDSDSLLTNIASFNAGQVPDIPVREVRV
ncbi:phage distal tail protein, Rcc01695 family [Sulfitobacter sp.]|uniref:phage distal tail protein, Rcc01695 family n=1 Tax=Sulfitobacter sp. TaxID=1903071 RepID=UPI003EF670A9